MTPVGNVPLTFPSKPPEAELTAWVGPLRSSSRYWVPAAVAAVAAALAAAGLYRFFGG